MRVGFSSFPARLDSAHFTCFMIECISRIDDYSLSEHSHIFHFAEKTVNAEWKLVCCSASKNLKVPMVDCLEF